MIERGYIPALQTAGVDALIRRPYDARVFRPAARTTMSDPNAAPDRLDVVAVAPHPDDLEILCGGTLAKLVKQGYKVGIFDLTSGEPTPRGSLETRQREAETARRILGVPLRVNVQLPNRVLMDAPENRFKLATEFRRYRPG